MTSYQVHRLTESERKYVETGEISGSYRPSQMESRVKEKIDLLPTRIRSLCNDVELLFEEDYLGPEDWRYGWFDLLDIHQPMQQNKLKTSFTRFLDEEGLSLATAPDEFGYDLGVMARRLMLHPAMVEHGDVLADMVWGFLQGVYWATDESPTDAVQVIEDRIVNNHDRHEQTMENLEFMTEQIGEISDRIDTYIGSVLENEGIDATDGVVKAVKNGIGDRQLTQEAADENTPMEEIIPPSQVLETVEQERIFGKQRLRGCLDRDARRLKEKGGTPPAEDILVAIEDSSFNGTSSRALAERLGNEKWMSRVTTVARDLSGNESGGRGGNREIFTEPPLLRGGRNAWELTAYGEALGHYLNMSASLRDLMPLLNIPDEIIDPALDELESLPSEITGKLPTRDTPVVDDITIGE
jgi:hypothetical protein